MHTIFPAGIALFGHWLGEPGLVTLFLISFLAATLVPLGSEWLLMLVLGQGGDPFLTVITATAGNYLGALTTYGIGLYGSALLIERLLRISPQQQEHAFRWYQRYGVVSLLFSFLPIVGDPLCLVGGVMKTDIRLFSLMVVTGKLARYSLVAWGTSWLVQ